MPRKTLVLVILDGWGIEALDSSAMNAISSARTPNYDYIMREFPHCELAASEQYVGLPEGQMGNSDVGHLNIGAGRLVKQLLPRIDEQFTSIQNVRKSLTSLIDYHRQNNSACHLMGLLSPGGIHSHMNHMMLLYDTLMDANITTYVHAFLDGRDTPPQSAKEYMDTFLAEGKRQIHTLSGRFYSMDRDNRWDRTELAYLAIVNGESPYIYNSAEEALTASYLLNQSDEFVQPSIVRGYPGVKQRDSILMANYRSDRARQLLYSFLDPDFSAFKRPSPPLFGKAVGMIEYSDTLAKWMNCLFPPLNMKNTLGEYLSTQGLTQLRVAETEKYAHVTFFFNGGKEPPFSGEKRLLIDSPKVKTYDMQPEMSAELITQAIVDNLGMYDIIVANYANADMVGHTGNFEASVKAVECIDKQLGILEKNVLQHGGVLLITSDHGNIECMLDHQTRQPHTAHTLNKVPFIVISEQKELHLTGGSLSDVAPTVLHFLRLSKPLEMSGKCLIY